MPDSTPDQVDVFDVVNYFLARDAMHGGDADVSPLKLQKLLYLAQANFLATTGHRLFNESIRAYEHGPVVYRVYTKYRGIDTALVHNKIEIQSPVLPTVIDDFLAKIWERWSPYSAWELRNLTHRQAPWRKNYTAGDLHTSIPDEDMTAYFVLEAPANDRTYPVASPRNTFDDDDSEHGVKRGMFATPIGGVISLPGTSRTSRSDRIEQLRSTE